MTTRRMAGVRFFSGMTICATLALALPGPAQAAQPVPVDKAFRFSIQRDPGGLALRWAALPGHYLYRDRFEAVTDAGLGLTLTTPPGERKHDPNFGDVEIYRDAVSIALPAADLPPRGALRVTYQGCAESGFCYAPVTKTIDLRTLAVTEE